MRYTLAALLGSLALLFCLPSLRGSGTARTLRVGYAEYYPYISADESGRPIGLAVDVLKEAANRCGVGLQWIRVESPEQALRSGQADLYPLLTVNPERLRRLNMSA